MVGERKNAGWQMFALVLLPVLTALGAYVGGYFAMSDLTPSLTAAPTHGKPELIRFYDARWKAALFAPATKVESMIRGQPVQPGFLP